MVDFEFEWLHTLFETNQANSVSIWQSRFDRAVKNWQLNRANQLLRIIKSFQQPLDVQGMIRFSEGKFSQKLGDWEQAQHVLSKALEIKRSQADQQGELAVLNSLANLEQHRESFTDDIFDLYDRAKKLAVELDDQEAQAAIHNGLGLVYYTRGELELARQSFIKVEAYARQHGRNDLEVTALHNLGSILWTTGQLSEAEVFFQKSLAIQKDTDDIHGQAETINSIGLIQEANGNWEEAQQTYTQGLATMQSTGDVFGQVQILVNLGNVAWLQGDLLGSLRFYKQALSITDELGDMKLKGQVLSGIGDTYRSLGQFEQAESAFQQAIEIKIEAGDERSLKHTYLGLGALHHNLKNSSKAQHFYELALDHARSQGDTRIEAVTRYNLSALHMAQGDFYECRKNLEAALIIAREHNYRDCLSWVYEQFGDLELLEDDPDIIQVLEHYCQALAYAADFNQILLQHLLQRLIAFWEAHAADGEVEATIWFCDNLIQLWQRMELDQPYPQPIRAFRALMTKLGKENRSR